MNALSHKHTPRRAPPATAMSGFSLIEMMVSITVGLMIVAALVGVLASNSRGTKSNDRTAELQSNGRYALDHLKREVHHAGYRGYTWAEPTTPTGISITNECLEAGAAANTFVQNIRQGVWGADDSNPYTANCLPATKYSLGDVLVLRRLANAPTPTASLVANTVYFRSTYAVGQMFQGVTGPTISGTPIADFALQEYVYYIGVDDNDATIPALRRISLTANAMVDEMVVSGIEQMQVQYGRAASNLNTQYFDASNIAGASTDSPTTLTTYAWDDVSSVRIWLLARNAKAETGYTNSDQYVMGNTTYGPMNDSFRRQLFTTVVQLRNHS